MEMGAGADWRLRFQALRAFFTLRPTLLVRLFDSHPSTRPPPASSSSVPGVVPSEVASELIGLESPSVVPQPLMQGAAGFELSKM
jgi:hypothetical protein